MASPFAKPAGVAFRGDVEEARRQGILRASKPETVAADNADGDDDDEVICCTSRGCWKFATLLALCLGIAGTVLGVLNILDDDPNAAVALVKGDNDGNPLGSDPNNPTDPNAVYDISPTLDAIRQRGVLHCGLPYTSTPGFAFPATSGGTFIGLDVDLCRAVAAAALGDASKHKLVELRGGVDRWTALQQGDVDLVLRSTWTMERDVYEPTAETGFTFSSPYFYDALVVAGLPEYTTCANNRDVTSSLACQKVRICVQGGTTHEIVMTQAFPDHVVVVPDQVSMYQSFQAGVCNVVASEGFNVSPATMARQGYNGELQVGAGNDDSAMDTTNSTTTTYFSKEPLAMVTRQDDPFWSDVVEWTLQALMEAEERGITQGNAELMGTTDVFGDELSELLIRVVRVAGNYGEMYEANLGAIAPRSGMNRINTGDSGMLYAFPFGNLQTVGPQLEEISPTVAAMKERGFLRCGVNLRKGFANFGNNTWTGLDVELCRALSAAIFDGKNDKILFVDLPAAQRFQVLSDKRVDCLARLTTHTLKRDVKEPSIEQGLSFAAPYFYDGVTFGGIPPYLECAENQDVFSPQCQGLRFCILEGTTGFTKVESLFKDDYISPRLTFNDIMAGLNDGSCNAIAGGFQDVAKENIRERGYLGPYEVGVKRYSKDPLALTTRQDDPAWTDLVRWVYWSLLYALEQDITQATATEMPRTTIFGPLRTNAFFHAVNAVGSYGELYDRNFGKLIPRGGVHSINRGDSPQMVSLPGFP